MEAPISEKRAAALVSIDTNVQWIRLDAFDLMRSVSCESHPIESDRYKRTVQTGEEESAA